MPTPVAGQTHDITITDDAAVETGYMLWSPPSDDKGLSSPRLAISREPLLAPKQYEGTARYSDAPPDVDLVWEIETFHKGGLSARWTPETAGRYNEGNAVDAHTPGELSLQNELYRASIYPRNGDFGSSTGWTLSGGATIGSGELEVDEVAARAQSANATNPSAFSSRPYTLGLTVTVVGPSATMRLGVVINGVDSYTDTVVAAGTSLITHTDTAGAGVTSFAWFVVHQSGASTTVRCDEAFMFHGDAIPRGFLEYSDLLYLALGRAVYVWSDANQMMEQVFVGPSNCLGLGVSPTDDVLIAGFGSDGYYSTTNGTTWTARVGPGGPYATVRNRIWGVRDNDTVSSSVDVTTPNWTDYNDVGTTVRAMTGIYAMNDVVVVGKEDGIWVYDRAANLFRNITPEFNHAPHTENFDAGIEWMGWLYLKTRRGVFRYNGVDLEDMTSYFNGPQTDDFGGRIKAFAIDGSRAYVLMDTPLTDASTSKNTWLMTFREIIDENGDAIFVVHPIHRINAGDYRAATVWYYSQLATPNNYIFMASRFFRSGTTYEPYITYMKIPERHDSPALDVVPDLAQDGTGTEPNALITQWWDGMLPDTDKALISMTFRVAGTVAAGTREIEVSMARNEDSGWTAWGTISATGVSTLYGSVLALANRSFKRLRLRFEIETNSATLAPRILLPIVVHTTYRPARPRHYEFTVMVSDNLPLRTGGTERDITAATLASRLDGYISDTWPSTLREDEDGDGTVTTHDMFVVDVSRLRQVDDIRTRQKVWLYKVVGIEKTLS